MEPGCAIAQEMGRGQMQIQRIENARHISSFISSRNQKSSNMPSSSSNSTFSGLRMSHSVDVSVQTSWESSKGRFIVVKDIAFIVGFMAGLLVKIEEIKTFRFPASPNRESAS